MQIKRVFLTTWYSCLHTRQSSKGQSLGSLCLARPGNCKSCPHHLENMEICYRNPACVVPLLASTSPRIRTGRLGLGWRWGLGWVVNILVFLLWIYSCRYTRIALGEVLIFLLWIYSSWYTLIALADILLWQDQGAAGAWHQFPLRPFRQLLIFHRCLRIPARWIWSFWLCTRLYYLLKCWLCQRGWWSVLKSDKPLSDSQNVFLC